MSANFTPFPDVPASPPHRTLRLLGWGAALLFAACLALAAWRMGGANYFGAHPISINRTTPKVARPLTGLHFSPQPTVTEFLRAGVFEQPLVPVGKPDPEENLALAHDLIAFQRAMAERGPDAVEPIVRFVGAWPHSAWTPALLLDLGLLYRRTGHFSLALDSYRRAWELTRDSVDPNGIRIGDMVLAQLSQFEAYLGRTELLEALLQETRGRPLHGTAAELVSDSYRGLAEMRSLPEISFRCGPMALARILFYGGRHPSPDVVHTLEESHSTPHGLSLTAVKAVSQKVGLNYQMAFRARGAPVVFPAVAHWKLGHYAALVDEIDGRYLVEDSTFGDNIHMSATTLDEEASGYFLIPPGPLPAGWRVVGEAEANAVWGRGNTGSNTDFGDTGTEAAPAFGDYFYSSGEPDPCFNGCTRWNVEAMVVGLSLHDTPVGYTPPVGPAVKTLIQYSQRDALQPMTFAYTNLGPKWTLSWLSYITDERTASGLVDLYERGGGDEKFTFASPTGTTSAPGMYSQSIVVATINSSGQTTGFTRQLPDGSVEQFNQAMGSQYFLTAVIDPQGNAVQLTYDSQLRIVSLTDAIGQVTTLSYGLSSDPLKLTKITDPFGRYATLTYNSSGQLASITDVLGITSSFAYGSSDFVNTLTTPYGKTTFTYGDPGTDSTLASASERYVTATDTLGRTSRVEFNQAPPGLQGLGCTSPPNVAPQGMPTACSYLPNLLNYRNTFVWDPYQLTYGATNGVPDRKSVV